MHVLVFQVNLSIHYKFFLKTKLFFFRLCWFLVRLLSIQQFYVLKNLKLQHLVA